jgi:hypothetical protein
MLSKIKKVIPESNLIKLSSFYDEAIIGFENNSNKCIYSIKKIIKVLIFKNKFSKKDAVDYFFENIYNKEENKVIFSDDFLNYEKND